MARRKKAGAVASPGRNTRSLKLLAKKIGQGNRFQDLPNCALAVLTHESFAAPASASHFSIATL